VIDSFTIGTPLAVDPGAPSTGGPRFGGIFPNPAFSEFTVSYELDRSDPATLQVLDAAGRVVMARAVDAAPGPGQQVLRRTGSMSPGVYWLRLSQSGRSSATRVVFMR
jgi:hypothetical protein